MKLYTLNFQNIQTITFSTVKEQFVKVVLLNKEELVAVKISY